MKFSFGQTNFEDRVLIPFDFKQSIKWPILKRDFDKNPGNGYASDYGSHEW